MARYAIYGAGSLGTVLGAFITKNGGEVDLINRNKAHVEALNTKGAKIIGTVDMVVPVKAITPDQMEGKYDVIVLLTKQLFNKEVVTMLKDYLTDNGVVVTLQNGIPEPLIAEIVGNGGFNATAYRVWMNSEIASAGAGNVVTLNSSNVAELKVLVELLVF